MNENTEKSSPESSISPEEVSKKLDYIIKRLDTLEKLILENPEYEGLAAPLRLTRMGLGLYEEPLRIATEMKTTEQSPDKPGTARAGIQANLILNVEEVKVGEDFALVVEMVNTGSASAQLVRIQNLIPEGFKVVKGPKGYRVENNDLSMKRKLLGPRRSMEVRLLLKPSTKGEFTLKTKIIYLDEVGDYQSYEPKPITIIVKELGISGWIRGPV